MKIFVTGGAGFIGSNFIRHVLSLNKGYKIVNLRQVDVRRKSGESGIGRAIIRITHS